jgi:hypothetical protein
VEAGDRLARRPEGNAVTAQILLHPKLPQVVSSIDVVRKFNALGYALSNTRARNIEAVPAVTTVVRVRPLGHPRVQDIFNFGDRPQ